MAEGGIAEEFETRDTGGLISVNAVYTELAARSQTPELRAALPLVAAGVPMGTMPRTESALAVDIGMGAARLPSPDWTGERIFSYEAIGPTRDDAVKWLLTIFGSVHGVGNADQEKKVLSSGVTDRAIAQMQLRKRQLEAAGPLPMALNLWEAQWTELENMAHGLYWIHNSNAFFVLSEGNAKFYLEKMFAGKEAPPFKDSYIQAVFKNCPKTQDGFNLLTTQPVRGGPINALENLDQWQIDAYGQRANPPNVRSNFNPRPRFRALYQQPAGGPWGASTMERYQWDLAIKFAENFGEVARRNRYDPPGTPNPMGFVGWWSETAGGDDPIGSILYPWRFKAAVVGAIGDAALEEMIVLSRAFDVTTYLQREVAGENFVNQVVAGNKPTEINPDRPLDPPEPISFPTCVKKLKRAFDAWDASMKALANPEKIAEAGYPIANHSRAGSTEADLLEGTVRPPGTYSINRRCNILAQLTAYSFSNFRQITNQESLKEFIKKQGGIRKFYERFSRSPELGNYPRTWNETRVQVGRWQGDLYSTMEAIIHGQNFGEAFRGLLKSGGEMAKFIAESGISDSGIKLPGGKK